MNPMKILTIALFILSVANVDAQLKGRIQPGKMYAAGDKIYAPKYGLHTVIPEGWEGTLPEGSEIFLLVPQEQIGGEVFTFISFQKDLKALEESWEQGVDLNETIKIKAVGEIIAEDNIISAEVVPAGHAVNKGNKGYVSAVCSPHGFCVTMLGIGPVQFYDRVQKAVTSFAENTTFTEPSYVSMYVDLNWKEYLSNKTLISWISFESATGTGDKENVFELCKDGTFTGKIKKKGIFKQMDKKYNGRQSGTWIATGIGETGLLKLTFKKLPEVEVSLEIKEEGKVFINSERYFVGRSEACKD